MSIQQAIEDFVTECRKELSTIEDVMQNSDIDEVDFSRLDANVLAVIERAQKARVKIQQHCDAENDARLRGNR